MENHDLGFPVGEADEPCLVDNGKVCSPEQSPLTERETADFYQVMRDEREKRQSLETELKNLRSGSPSPLQSSADPELGKTVYANNLRVSRRFAETDYGREVVSAVHDWAAAKCDLDPVFNARMRASDDPYEAAKKAYDQEIGSRTTASFTAFPIPPRSLADAPGNGAVGKPYVPVGDGNAYEALFK